MNGVLLELMVDLILLTIRYVPCLKKIIKAVLQYRVLKLYRCLVDIHNFYSAVRFWIFISRFGFGSVLD